MTVSVSFAQSRRIYIHTVLTISLSLWQWLFYGNAATFAENAERHGISLNFTISMRLLPCLVGEVLFYILWKEIPLGLAIVFARIVGRIRRRKDQLNREGELFMNTITIITTRRAAVVTARRHIAWNSLLVLLFHQLRYLKVEISQTYNVME